MAKTSVKQPAKKTASKRVTKPTADKTKASKSNKKTLSATKTKQESKQDSLEETKKIKSPVLTTKTAPVEQLSEPEYVEPVDSIVPDDIEVKKPEPTPVAEAKQTPQENKGGAEIAEVNKNSIKITKDTTFLVVSDCSFLGGNVRLQAGCNIKRADNLNYEFRGVNLDGTPIGTLFDCVDEAESNAFMKEVVQFIKSGSIIINQSIDQIQAKIEAAKNTETSIDLDSGEITNKQSDEISQDNQTPVVQQPVSQDYSHVPVEEIDMSSYLSQIADQPVMSVNVQETKNVTVTDPTNTNPIQPPAQIHQVHGFHHTQHNPNPIAHNQLSSPSQNPFLQTPIAEQKNPMTDEAFAFEEMKRYADSIVDIINGTFQVRVQGSLPMVELQNLINSSSKDYTYEIKKDSVGFFLNLSRGQLQVRVPQDFSKYLPVA